MHRPRVPARPQTSPTHPRYSPETLSPQHHTAQHNSTPRGAPTQPPGQIFIYVHEGVDATALQQHVSERFNIQLARPVEVR